MKWEGGVKVQSLPHPLLLSWQVRLFTVPGVSLPREVGGGVTGMGPDVSMPCRAWLGKCCFLAFVGWLPILSWFPE